MIDTSNLSYSDFPVNAVQYNIIEDTDGDTVSIPEQSNTDTISQGFTIKDFAVQDEHGNWNNTIESIVFSNQEGKQNTWTKYWDNIEAGKISGADAFAACAKGWILRHRVLSLSLRCS